MPIYNYKVEPPQRRLSERQIGTFATGAKRDIAPDKSRPDLIQSKLVQIITDHLDLGKDVMMVLTKIGRGPTKSDLIHFIMVIIYHALCYHPITRLEILEWQGRLLAKGAQRYGDRNWEKGMPFYRTYQSLVRHTISYLNGEEDEDHLSSAIFNAFALYYYLANFDEEKINQLNDMKGNINGNTVEGTNSL